MKADTLTAITVLAIAALTACLYIKAALIALLTSTLERRQRR